MIVFTRLSCNLSVFPLRNFWQFVHLIVLVDWWSCDNRYLTVLFFGCEGRVYHTLWHTFYHCSEVLATEGICISFLNPCVFRISSKKFTANMGMGHEETLGFCRYILG